MKYIVMIMIFYSVLTVGQNFNPPSNLPDNSLMFLEKDSDGNVLVFVITEANTIILLGADVRGLYFMATMGEIKKGVYKEQYSWDNSSKLKARLEFYKIKKLLIENFSDRRDRINKLFEQFWAMYD